MAVISKDLGAVTAYAAAVNRGYTGTKEEFETLMASYATVAQQAAESAQSASSSAQGAFQAASSANAAMNNARTAESNAQSAASGAQGYAQYAQQSAQSASQYAQSAESAKDTAVDAVDGFASGAQQALDGVNQAGNNWKSLAQAKALDSEAWAVGQRDGEDVGTQDETYHNNAKWYAQQGSTSAQTATEAAQTATTKAGEAAQSASAAAESAASLVIDTEPTEGSAHAVSSGAVYGLKEDLGQLGAIIVNTPDLTKYLYKKNMYINNNGVETVLNGYDTYKIPCRANQIIRISWSGLSELPWQGFNTDYAWKIFKSDDSFIQVNAVSTNNGYIFPNNKEGIAVCPADTVYTTLTVKRGNESGVVLQIDKPSKTVDAYDMLTCDKAVHAITEENAIKTQFYINSYTQTFGVMGSSVKVLFLHVHTGDVLNFTTLRTGTSMRANFRASDGTMSAIGNIVGSSFVYTVPSDGVMSIYYLAGETGDVVINPKIQIQIDAKNVVGLSDGTQFNGLSGVAFGTSLTYRKVSGKGYLNQLEPLSGITFDNQGVGSSVILGNGDSLDMLAHIKGYTEFSDKKICILEGFVNDWYTNRTLGTYKDTGETTVCGCVRSALNYIMSQNSNLTVFLILDHYGRLYNTLDCSTGATNASGITQFEYYSEIAKIAESMGIPVIKEFAISQISENTPQYLADNIHCNVLGAKQSGNAIWSQIKQYMLNVV